MLIVPKRYELAAETLYDIAMQELQFYRRSRLMSKLAAKTGLSVDTLYDFADGKTKPTYQTIWKVVDGLGYDLVLRKRSSRTWAV